MAYAFHEAQLNKPRNIKETFTGAQQMSLNDYMPEPRSSYFDN
jgi:hypothetical protein